MDNNTDTASQVCWNCKSRKRKCSKELPSCSLCSKLLLKCEYDYSSSILRDQDTSSELNENTLQLSTTTNSLPDLALASRLQAALSDGYTGPANIASQVFSILTSNGDSVPSAIFSYFQTIDTWLPILSEEHIRKRLEYNNGSPSVEFACLLLCIYLVARNPDNITCGNGMPSSTYLKTRSLHSALSSSGRKSIEIIQASLLLAVYELGYGMVDAALFTMAGCSRLAIAMMGTQRKLGVINIQDTEFGRLWWGIIIMDRYMNLGVAPEQIHMSAGSPRDVNLQIRLPLNTDLPDSCPQPSAHIPSRMSAASNPTTRRGAFCRSAEAVNLLGQTLNILIESSCSRVVDIKVSATLDVSLQELASSLLNQAVNSWEECCVAIGLCFSALLVLHKMTLDLCSNSNESAGCNQKEAAAMAIQTVTRIIIDIARKFLADLAFIDLLALPLPYTFCLYQAALLHIEFAGDEFLSPRWSSGMESLQGTLRHFANRWNIGNQYLLQIESATIKEANSRFNADGEPYD